MFYTASYAAMNVGAFAVVSHFAAPASAMSRWKTMPGWDERSPLLAATLTIFCFR